MTRCHDYRYAATYGVVGDMAENEETRLAEPSPAPDSADTSVPTESESGAEMNDSDV
jgi:hypothetical protein